MKDICYWELDDPQGSFEDWRNLRIRANKYLLVIDDNGFAKYKYNLTKLGIANEVNCYEDFLKVMQSDYNYNKGELKDESK